MRFLLLHSPLVTEEIWVALVASLEAAGYQATVVPLKRPKPSAEVRDDVPVYVVLHS